MKSPFRPPTTVGKSRDLTRIMEIPRRPIPTDAELEVLADEWTAKLRRPGHESCGCRVKRLLGEQAWAISEAVPADGLLALMGVGRGKTLVWILLPLVMNAKAAHLLPPGLVEQFFREYQVAAEHFFVPTLISEKRVLFGEEPEIHLIPYSRLQMPDSSAMLDELEVDLIMADEMHQLKRLESARTRRVARALANRPGTRFAGGTGSPISNTIKDLGHLSAFALGDSSPLPHDSGVLEIWATAVDPSSWRAAPGRLLDLGGDDARDAVACRIRETSGVITASGRGGAVASIIMRQHEVVVPLPVKQALHTLRNMWSRPDGEEFVDILRVSHCALQLACGFYYKWVFPKSIPQTVIDDWFDARRDWSRELRRKQLHPSEGMDSPELCRRAAHRYWNGYVGDLPTWRADSYPRWRDVAGTVPHDIEIVWISDFLAQSAAAWAKVEPGIVWYQHRGLGEKISQLTGLPLLVGDPVALRAEKGDRSVILSVQSYGQGWDGLQHLFHRQLVLEPVPNWEQLLGRLNRIGQRADEVITEVCRHTIELRSAIDKAFEEAKFAKDLNGPQMMLSADVEWGLTIR